MRRKKRKSKSRFPAPPHPSELNKAARRRTLTHYLKTVSILLLLLESATATGPFQSQRLWESGRAVNGFLERIERIPPRSIRSIRSRNPLTATLKRPWVNYFQTENFLEWIKVAISAALPASKTIHANPMTAT